MVSGFSEIVIKSYSLKKIVCILIYSCKITFQFTKHFPENLGNMIKENKKRVLTSF